MSDLIERLRAVEYGPSRTPGVTTTWQRNPDGPEAADEIDRLTRELTDIIAMAERREDDLRRQIAEMEVPRG
jgi:hypothetical protein